MKPSILIVCLVFILGNILGSLGITVSLFCFVILLVFAISVSVSVLLSCQSKKILYILFYILSLGFGYVRFVLAERDLNQNTISEFKEKIVGVIGQVVGEPVVKPNYTRVKLKLSSIAKENRVEKVKNEFIFVYTDPSFEVSTRDTLLAQGKISQITNKNDDFNFVYYAKKDKVLFQMFQPTVEIVDRDKSFIGNLKNVKYFFEERLNHILNEPHSALLSGMIISGKGALPQKILDDFTKVGLVHIVVLSGFNVAIISSFFLAICLYLRRSLLFSFFVVCFALVLFVLIAGGSPPVLRAVLMGSLVLVGKVFAKSIDPNKALFFVASILACINPYSVPFDPSFQLSFLATFGVINFTDMFKLKLTYIHFDLLKEIISSTLGALIMVSPFILYTMGTFSVVAIVVNVLLLPLVPLLMLLGFLVVVFSFFEPLAYFLGFFATTLSSVMFKVVSLFASLPFASITIKNISAFFILLLYGLILFWLYKNKKVIVVTQLDKTEPY